MSIEDKRERYRCGDSYVTLDEVDTWNQFFEHNQEHLLDKSK